MASYEIPEQLEFHEEIEKLSRKDPADAESVFNPLIQKLFENTAFVRALAQAIAEQNELDHAAIRRETAEGISSAIEAIPTPDVSGQIAEHDGAASAHAGKLVPVSRTVNGKPLSSDISLTASDVGAAGSGHSHTAEQVGALPAAGGTIAGNLRLQKGNYGTILNFGDGDYVHLSEPTDDCLEIKAKKINFVLSDSTTSRLSINGQALTVAMLGGTSSNHTHTPSQVGISITNYAPSSLTSGQIALVYV